MQSASKYKIKLDKKTNTHLGHTLQVFIITFSLFFLFACDSPQVFIFDFDTRLSDGKKMEVIYEIYFEDNASVNKLKKNMDKIEYALTMVFSKTSSKDLTNKSRIRLKNSLVIILEKHFNGNVKDVRIANFIIRQN
ncbi:hypothetical protein [Desulfobacula sp.]|uniref:hypothetical protein n=1 Tax=Desulfobacula sp. TaxID=2593537 RepID=UPI00263395B0|nr:hypothetical protein [Desulfobacula sp.]